MKNLNALVKPALAAAGANIAGQVAADSIAAGELTLPQFNSGYWTAALKSAVVGVGLGMVAAHFYGKNKHAVAAIVAGVTPVVQQLAGL